MNKKTRKLFTWCLVVALVVTQMLFANVAFAATSSYKGASRYATAQEIVKNGWANGSDTVVLVNGEKDGADLADALAAAPLAFANGKAPVLLTESAKLSDGVQATLDTLKAKKVIVVGGEKAVSKAVFDGLVAKYGADNVSRVFGDTRVNTALEAAKKVVAAPTAVVLVNGYASADALSAASIAAAKGMPILFTDGANTLSDAVKAYIGTAKVYVIGGKAVVADTVLDAVKGERVFGDNRFATNNAVLTKFAPDLKTVYLAKGADENAADALAGAPLAALTNSAIVFVDGANTVDAAKATLSGKVTNFVGLGGLITDAVLASVQSAVNGATLNATVSATGASKLTVTFNKAVDDTKATLTVKKGTVAVNTDKVEFAADKMSAVLTTTTKLTKGDYTVTVSGLTDTALSSTVSVVDEKVSKINITSAKAPRLALDNTKALVRYEVLNQYGEKMINQSISWTISTGKAVSNEDPALGTFEITAAGTPAVDLIPGAIVYITGVHTASGTVVNGQVEVALASQPDAINFKGVYDTTKSVLADLPAGFTAGRYVLLFEVMDQYGNKISPSTLGGLVFTSTNPLFVSSNTGNPDFAFAAAADVTLNNVTYKAVTLVPGSSVANGGAVTVQAISTVTGKQSTYAINATALAAVKTFKMSAPTKIVAEGEKVEIPYTAEDQYGKAVTAYASLAGGKITLSSGLAFEKQDDASAKLMFTAPTTGASATVDLPVYLTSVVVNGGDFSSLMVSVKDTAVPTAVVGFDSTSKIVTSIAKSNSKDITYADLDIQDQYGRTMSDAKIAAWLSASNEIVLTSEKPASDASPFTVVSTDNGSDAAIQYINGTSDKFTIAAKGSGTLNASESLVFALTTNTGTDTFGPKSFTFTRSLQSAYASYEVADLGTMYNDSAAGTQTATDYNKTVKVYGVLANGTKVLLPTTDYTVSTDAIVSSVEKLHVTGNVISDVAANGYVAADFKDASNNYADVTVNVLVTVNDNTGSGSALAIVEKTLKVSNKAPKADTITVDDDYVADGKATITANVISNATLNSYIEEVDDQYGIASAEVPSITVTGLSKVDGSTLTVANNGTSTAALTGATLGDKFTATYKYASGVKVAIEFTVGLDSAAPEVTTVAVANHGVDDTIDATDTITITFNEATNKPALDEADFTIENSHSFGSAATTFTWNAAGTVLTITLAGTPTIVAGDDISFVADTVKDAAGNSVATDVFYTVVAADF